jgi:outer membrane protein insertion porin family
MNKYILVLFLAVSLGIKAQVQQNPVSTEFQVDYFSPKEYEIGPIRIDGADNFDHQTIKMVAGLKSGMKIKIPGQKITDAIQNLWKEGLFSSIDIQVEKEINGVVFLAIKLVPRPKLSRFKFVGASKKDIEKLRELISLYSGKTINEALVLNTQNKIKGYFKEKGYYSVNVRVEQEPDKLMNNASLFTIYVDKGQKVKIKDIEIEGNLTNYSNFEFLGTFKFHSEKLAKRKIRNAMEDTKRKSIMRIFSKSKFMISAYEKDKQSIVTKLNSKGLRDARIIKDTFYLEDSKHIKIKLSIDEGNIYRFGKIQWLGNTKFSSGYLDTVLGVKQGDIYNKSLLESRITMSQDGRDISSLYMDRGYLFFQVIPIETNIENNEINYQMRIIEGKEARVKRIVIKGNTKTNDHVIRREIRTKPGDLFNRNDIIRTQRELSQLGYFNNEAFQINPIPNPQDGTVDIEYTVEEKSSDQIELSGGYGAGRIVGTLGLTFNNFSLKRIFEPNSWQPLPSGDGQKLSLRAQTNGTFFQSYTFSFTEPWLGGKKPNSLSTWINHSQFGTGLLRSNPNYSGISITGAGIGFGRRKKFPDDFFNAYYEIAYQYYDVSNYPSYFPSFSNGYANDISVKYVLQRNSIDNPIFPKEGSQMVLTAKSSIPYFLFNGNKDFSTATQQEKYKYLEYFKLKFTGSWFLPITSDKKLVLMPRIGFGFMGAYSNTKGLTPFERFALGGNGLSGMNQLGGREMIALRGYNDNSLSSSASDPIITKYTLELRYPISLNPQATFYVLAFGEAGNTYTNIKQYNPFNVKRSAGVGVRVFLPMFGMLGLDYGWGFDYLDPHAQGYRVGGGSDQSIQQKGYFGKLNFTIGMNLGEL